MQTRPYGRQAEPLSVIGFGGIVVMKASDDEAARRVGRAIDAGVNYFDVAPSYGDAEERLGPALAPYRDRVFLACKTGKRDRAGAEEELRGSLARLRTDRFDLYQLHAVTTADDVAQIFASGGALEALVAAREAGLVRHLGFSAHSAEAAVELLARFPFDSVLFPLNRPAMEAGFGPQVIEAAQKAGASILALKAMARGPWADGAARRFDKTWYEPVDEPRLAELSLRYTLSLPVTAALPPGEESLFELAIAVASDPRPLAPDELAELRGAPGFAPIFSLQAA